MQLRQLNTFRTVAETLNITRAAERLNYAQSSVTEQIQSLEADIGVALFDRTGRRLRLTAAGNRLVDYAERMLALAEEARAVVAGMDDPVGELAIGAPETLCVYRLPALLTRFRETHANVRVLLRPGNRSESRNGVREGTLDLCFTFGPPPTEPEFESMALAPEPVVVVAPPGHPLTKPAQVRTEELAGVNFLVTEQGCSYRRMYDEMLGSSQGPRPRIVAELASIGALRTCVAEGMGCALLPRIAVAADLARGALETVPWMNAHHETDVHVTWRRDGVPPSGLRPFLDTTRELLGSPVG
ncbi:LysR family transcriptional regulator [Streptomyces sp. NBC_01537]|uniref:LysR family transcriptional regulator n=1 Tax=Streptomyces sp. NBC_01537 TaxID=2903896 RepID=UPI00386F9153